MTTTITKEEVLNANLEEEASVLEIHNELVRRIPAEDSESLRVWLKTKLAAEAAQERIGFYLDEFGARDIRDIDTSEALALMGGLDVWLAQSDTMLHVYLLET
ncbi:MAG: hypothetical protein Q8L60_06305 [Gammaproteobacteria bacterium]|nr:hypothetical protein [Gammaproteobacteria bacterium]MDP2139407.1 hypothetical protein [Gammaproteobacteria bacterium]MDP2346243.1 hypothetical protein [Gammaproteobacteria bacterium]